MTQSESFKEHLPVEEVSSQPGECSEEMDQSAEVSEMAKYLTYEEMQEMKVHMAQLFHQMVDTFFDLSVGKNEDREN